MQMITKGYVWLSSLLVTAGIILSWLLWPFMENAIHILKNYEYGKYVLLLGIGIPMAGVNILETKYVWGYFLKNTKLDLLGISVGFMIGLMIGYIGPPL